VRKDASRRTLEVRGAGLGDNPVPVHVERTTAEQVWAAFRADPVIASVKDAEALRDALDSDSLVVFLRFGSLLTLGDLVAQTKAAGRICFVDVDLLDGFAGRPVVIEYLTHHTDADGIVSAKPSIVRAAREHGLVAGHRFFLLDSQSYKTMIDVSRANPPDFIEVLPGCLPRVIGWIREELDLPVIAGGLICDRRDALDALDAGASAVVSSRRGVWNI
jgi:glycerol uptake operon antiterminator